MGDGTLWSWAGLLFLGAWHGINPGMGWLFAVALGLQEGTRTAVWKALVPLAVGHGLAVAGAILVGAMLGLVLPGNAVKWVVAVALIGCGVFRAVRHRHPRWGAMRVGSWDLTLWSFLMASAHGAGLMVLPIILGAGPHAAAAGHAPAGGALAYTAPGLEHGGLPQSLAPGHLQHGAHAATLFMDMSGGQGFQFAATLVHTLGYLIVTGGVAVLVYEKLGLRLLRTWWFNLDLFWAAALMLAGAFTPFI
jgi:hypothetical protein